MNQHSLSVTTTEVPLSKVPNPHSLLGYYSKKLWVYVCTWMGEMQRTNSKYGTPVRLLSNLSCFLVKQDS